MKMSHILCTMLACALLTFEARATASSADGPSSAAAANIGDAAGRAAPSRNAGAKPGRAGDRGLNQAGAQTGIGSKGRGAAVAASPRHGSGTSQAGVAQGGAAQAGRSNADRLHSLLNAQARGRLARQPGRVGSTRAVTRGPDDVRGPQGRSPAGQSKMAALNGGAPPAAVPAGQPKVAASSSAAPSASRLSSTPGYPAIRGPHVQGLGRVGGPAISRATHSAIVDGAQLHRKF
jgi:hypothetical protein